MTNALNAICIPSAVAAIFFTSFAYALPDDSDKPLHATSQQAQLLQASQTGIYKGDVHVQQGSTLLDADQLTIQLDTQHQIKSAIATGNPATYTTIVKAKENPLVAKAKRIEYYPPLHQVILLGDAFVTRNKDSYASQTIYYNTQAQTVISPKLPGQRTTIVIQPSSQNRHSA